MILTNKETENESVLAQARIYRWAVSCSLQVHSAHDKRFLPRSLYRWCKYFSFY